VALAALVLPHQLLAQVLLGVVAAGVQALPATVLVAVVAVAQDLTQLVAVQRSTRVEAVVRVTVPAATAAPALSSSNTPTRTRQLSPLG
jgi:hypothetical protein